MANSQFINTVLSHDDVSWHPKRWFMGMWALKRLLGLCVVAAAVFASSDAVSGQETGDLTLGGIREWSPQAQAAWLADADAQDIAFGLGYGGGKSVDVTSDVRLRVPDGMLALPQPYADYFLARVGVDGHPKTYAVAMPWPNGTFESRGNKVISRGIALIRVESPGHVALDRDRLDANDLLTRVRSDFGKTARDYGVEVLKARWLIPPTLNATVPSLEWEAEINIRDAGGADVADLPSVLLLGRTTVVRLEYLSASGPTNLSAIHDGGALLDRLRVLASNVEFSKGSEYAAYHAEDDPVSEAGLDELVASKPDDGKGTDYKGIAKAKTIAKYAYWGAAIAMLLGFVATKLGNARNERIRQNGLDATGKFIAVDWQPYGKKQEAVWFTLELQMPDGSLLPVKRMMTFSIQEAAFLKGKIAVGLPCEARLDRTKPSRFVLTGCLSSRTRQ